MNKIVLLIGVVIFVAIGGYFVLNRFTGQPLKTNTQQTQNDVQISSERLALYPIAEVAKHATKDDCWLAIEGSVYDVTDYVKNGFHPGGDAIVNGCGKDATQMFSKHSEKARKLLQNYAIGSLQD